MNKNKSLIVKCVIALFLVYGLTVAFRWTEMRVYVPADKALLVMNKFGDPLPPNLVVVPTGENHFKGVQEEVLGPGRYFFNPISYHTELVDLLQIPAGDPHNWEWNSDGTLKNPTAAPMVGLVMMKQGKVAPNSQEVVPAGFKGIQAEVLTPGTYKINPQLEEMTLLPATIVPPGSVGVVTRLVGDTKGISISLASLDHAPPSTRLQPSPRPTKKAGWLSARRIAASCATCFSRASITSIRAWCA